MGRKLAYFFRETGIALRRNALVTFAAISTVFISLFLLGGALLVQQQVDLMAGDWARRVEVSIFLRDDASTQEVRGLNQTIGGMPEVQEHHFESKEQAYQRFRELFKDSPTIIENVGPEALPESYRVKLKDPEKFSVIRARLAGEPAIAEIKDERAVLNKLLAVTGILRTGAMAVAALMLLAAAGLIGNTVRMAVFARRREIAIMKLVGATNWFIRVPFLIEGMVQGLLGAGMAIAFLFGMKVLFIDPLRSQALFGFIPWFGTSHVLVTVPWLLGFGVLIAAVASLIAMRRFLEV